MRIWKKRTVPDTSSANSIFESVGTDGATGSLAPITSRFLKVVLAVCVMAAACVSLGASPAAASAFGCSGFRTVNSPWGVGNVNSYCVRLDGTGTYVNYVSGSYTANVGTVCNSNITAEFFDTSGHWYMTRQTGVRYGCYWGTQGPFTIPIYQYVRPGSMCSTLKQNGARLTSVCHSIY